MDLSSRLSYLFGSQEYVSIRRQLVLLREKLLNHRVGTEQANIVCSGSLGEGVAYPTSDDDVMYCTTASRVVATYRQVTQTGDLLMVISEYSPGYCLLLDLKGTCLHFVIHIIDGQCFLSSSLWKQLFVEEGQVIHGPCQSGNIAGIEYDDALCISCYSWPEIANDWVMRSRLHGWPSYELTQNIVQNGCHVVPVGDPDSPYGQHEWRISFSVGERALMHSFNHAQFLTYNLLRLTLKRIIEIKAPDVLCSYFMKTTLFYTAENTSIELWQFGNLEICLKSCLSVLYDYVDQIYCPNYFIPEYNMIKRKVNQTNRHLILDIIRYVHRIGIVGVLHLSGESFCLEDVLSTRMMEYKLDREFMSSRHFLDGLGSIDKFFQNFLDDDIDCLFPALKMWCFLGGGSAVIGKELLRFILNNGMVNSCKHMLNRLCGFSYLNKSDYRLHKRIQYQLRSVYNGDLTRGKLTMANYMYIVGKIDSALITIRQLLSDYPPYAIDFSSDDLKSATYMDTMCSRGYSIDYKLKCAYVPPYVLNKECIYAFPRPLNVFISMINEWNMDPLTYTFFLQSLCYVQQRNQLLLRNSMRCLVNHTDDLDHDSDKVNVRMCVGIIKYVQGDSQSACRWLGSAYVMKNSIPPPIDQGYSLSVLTYISCLLNRNIGQTCHKM